jgi:hypothetical protein
MEAPSFAEVGLLQQALRDAFAPRVQELIELLNAQGKHAPYTTSPYALL